VQALGLWEQGHAVQMAGDIVRAIQLYSQSLALYPTAEAHTFRGWAYSFQGDYDQAISECEKAIALDPNFGNPYNDIGSYLLQKGESDEALDWFERAKTASRYTARHYPYINLARVYISRGLVLAAIREFEGALEQCPGDARCEKALASLRSQLN
jgi:tetratricopeptide (TPR) repeat protein